jgi:hypothetical protein
MADPRQTASPSEALAAECSREHDRQQEFSLELEEIWLRDQFTGNADGPPGLSMRRTVEAQGRLQTSPAGCCAVTTPLPAPPDESDRNLSAPNPRTIRSNQDLEIMGRVVASFRKYSQPEPGGGEAPLLT